MKTEPRTLGELTDEIRRNEHDLAPGSETSLWGDYLEDMRVQCGVIPIGDYDRDLPLPPDAAEYWMDEYWAFKVHQLGPFHESPFYRPTR